MKRTTAKLLFLVLVLTQIAVTATPVDAQENADLYGAAEQTWITPYPENPGARFGNAIDYSRDTIVVGSKNDSVFSGGKKLYGAGAAYVYVRGGHTWVQGARLSPESPQPGENFGVSVSIYGDTIVVGASGRNSEEKTDTGAVYVFTRNGDEWRQETIIEPEDGDADDYFGTAVAIYGNRIVVGADGKDIGDDIDAGKVYTFYKTGNHWYESKRITPSSPVADSSFGYALALEGARLVVGAPSELDIGAAYIFYRTGSTWVEEGKIEANDERFGDRFGSSVAIQGGTVVVGAPYADPDLGTGRMNNAGAVYVFRQKGNDWQQSARIVPENGYAYDHFGVSVAVDHKMVVAGAPGFDYFGRSDAGAAYLFKLTGGQWVSQTRVVPSHPDEKSSYGASIILDNDRILIGKPGPVTQAGMIYIYAIEAGVLPETGFGPHAELTKLPNQQQNISRENTLWLEIPRLSVKAGILGVPRQGNGWDVSWLGNTIGYLEGSAYPLWMGNTVLSGHVSLPGGNPGPFSEIHTLRWGDPIIIHNSGSAYKYEVREVFQTSPKNLNVLERSNHFDWLTLITCSQFDPVDDIYKYRTVVVAVRVE